MGVRRRFVTHTHAPLTRNTNTKRILVNCKRFTEWPLYLARVVYLGGVPDRGPHDNSIYNIAQQ